MKNLEVFPFAFNLENFDSRQIIGKSKNHVKVRFDMTLENTQKCAAVAFISDEFEGEIRLNISNVSGNLSKLRIEQKK